MDYQIRKHNTPISTLIKQYLDKKGGKVVVSRKEIVWRFNALDWRYQKQILFAFLASGLTDRTWAYKKLFVYWDNCFIPVLQDLWEKHPSEEMLTWLIIRYFPIDFLQRNYINLNKGRNYFYLCVRMSDVKGFVIDRTRLNECDLLRIKQVLGEAVSIEYAKDLFYLIIYKYCKGVYKFRSWQTVVMEGKDPVLSILNRPLINKMLHEIKNLGIKGFDLSFELQKWIMTVTNNFLSKHEGIPDKRWDMEEEEKIREMQMEYCYEQIDPEYRKIWDTFDCHHQQQFLDYLDKRHEKHQPSKVNVTKETTAEVLDRITMNPYARKLIDNFDLEVIEPSFNKEW